MSSSRWVFLVTVGLLAVATGLIIAAGSGSAQQPTLSPTASPSPTSSSTATPSTAVTPSPTVTPQPTAITTVETICPFHAPATGPIVNVAAAPVIVIGTAGETVPYFDEVQLLIFSNTTFHVEVIVRGSVASTITVRTVGGIVGDLTLVSEHEPVFFPGQRSRLFLEPGDDGTYVVVGLAEGKQDLPPGVTAADPACRIPALAVPRTGVGAHSENGRAILALLAAGLALTATGGLALGRLRQRT